MEAPPPSPLPDPAVLMDELVEEFLLRLPPEDPALLARAALVSRQWYRVVTDPSFRRRFREFHRSTPLLGYILNLADSIRFVPMSSFRPPHTHRGGVRAVSSSHGRVLLHRSAGENLYALRSTGKDPDVLLSVWDPITDEQQDLPVVPLRPSLCFGMSNWDAVLICTNGDGCNHLHCHFKVVFVGKRLGTFSCFYSSEADSWSDPVFASEGIIGAFIPGNCVLIESTLYGKSAASYDIFKYDMLPNQMCNIRIILGPGVRLDDCMLIATEDGRLGVAKASNSILVVWVREHGRWEESRTIDLQALLPLDALPDPLLPYEVRPWLTGFAETGAAVIFLWTRVGYFTIDLKSGSCKKVGEDLVSACVVPYVSFCTPGMHLITSKFARLHK
jgi:hypothetical protein